MSFKNSDKDFSPDGQIFILKEANCTVIVYSSSECAQHGGKPSP